MAFGWGGAAAGAQGFLDKQAADELTRALAERKYQMELADLDLRKAAGEQNARRVDLEDKRFGLSEKQFADDQAATARQTSQENNQRGMRQMIGTLVMGQNGKPLDAATRQSVQGMGISEGLTLPNEITADPDAKFNEFKREQDLRQQHELAQIAARERAQASGSGGSDQVWVLRNGQVTPIRKGTAQPGDQPYDAVAARRDNTAPEAQETASEVKRIATALLNHEGLDSAFGVLDAKMPTFFQSTAEAEELQESLKALLSIDNMSKMKGVLSDNDMRVIQRASTTLNSRMGSAAARAELKRLADIQTSAAPSGGGGGVMVNMVAPDGSVKPVPAEQVEYFRQRGAKVVP